MRTVLMLAIPDSMRRGARPVISLDYVPYARSTWEWWCRTRGIRFLFVDNADLPSPFDALPPSVRRWVIAGELLRSGESGQLAVVDADTMVRWDTPDFFELAGRGLGAVRDPGHRWIRASLSAYAGLCPGVRLEPENYFNTGVVVVSRDHAALLEEFGRFYVRNLASIRQIRSAGADFGLDQTLMNLLVQRSGLDVVYLPRAFNMVHCIFAPEDFAPGNAQAAWWEKVRATAEFDRLFAFVDRGYIWHFCGLWVTRARFMQEVWRRVQGHYAEEGPKARMSAPI